MRAHDTKRVNVNRQQLRRDARRNGLDRCAVCGKTSTRHNLAVHARAGVPAPAKE